MKYTKICITEIKVGAGKTFSNNFNYTSTLNLDKMNHFGMII